MFRADQHGSMRSVENDQEETRAGHCKVYSCLRAKGKRSHGYCETFTSRRMGEREGNAD